MDDIMNDNARAEDDDEDDEFDEEEEEEYYEDDDEVEEEGVVTDAVVGEQAVKKKGSRGIIWTTKEDECMVESWKAITTGEITGINQSSTA